MFRQLCAGLHWWLTLALWVAALPGPLSGNGTTNQTPPFAAEEIRWAFAADFVAEEDEFVPEEAMAEEPGLLLQTTPLLQRRLRRQCPGEAGATKKKSHRHSKKNQPRLFPTDSFRCFLFRDFSGFHFFVDFARPSLFHLFPNYSISFPFICTCCRTVLSRPQHSGLWLRIFVSEIFRQVVQHDKALTSLKARKSKHPKRPRPRETQYRDHPGIHPKYGWFRLEYYATSTRWDAQMYLNDISVK